MPHEDRASPASHASNHCLRAIATIARYTAAEAVHSRVMVSALLIMVAGVTLGQFTTELALSDSRGISAAGQAWLFRLAAVFLITSFAVSSLVREANDKGLELMLSLPLPRAGYLLGKWVGCAIAAALLTLLFAIPLLFTAPWIGVCAWATSMFFELSIVVSASLLCALTFSHVVASLAAVTAFYALSRIMSALLAIGGNTVAPEDSTAFHFATTLLEAIAAMLPRLDRFSRTEWLVADMSAWADMPWLATQSAIYVALLLSAAYVDLMRKSV